MTIPTDIPIKQITYNGTVVPIDTGGSVLDRTVTFKYNNEDYEIYSVNAGGSIPAPTTPAIPSGQVFSGWKTSATGGSAVSFPYTPSSEEVTLYGSASEPAYLTFSSPNAFSMASSRGWNGTIEVSTDHMTWSTWLGGRINAVARDGIYYLYFRGTGNSVLANGVSWTINGSSVSAYGNIEYLLDYMTVVNGNHPSMDSSCCYDMFEDCAALVSAPELPTVILTSDCYHSMFRNCVSLISAPMLPATVLATFCYTEMFYGCTSLTTAPVLPATTLADYCYDSMFSGCSSLKVYSGSGSGHDKAWRIPARGYAYYMFEGTIGNYTYSDVVTLNTTFYTQNTPV